MVPHTEGTAPATVQRLEQAEEHQGGHGGWNRATGGLTVKQERGVRASSAGPGGGKQSPFYSECSQKPLEEFYTIKTTGDGNGPRP